jgi:hypothetical protein
MKPFKTVTVEYYEEFLAEEVKTSNHERRIKVVTTTREWGLSSTHDPIMVIKLCMVMSMVESFEAP